MTVPESLLYLPFLAPVLYAETHYRFKYFFSWLKKSEPEIIADLPSRIEKGNDLPLLIIVKDADKYTIDLIRIEVIEQNKIVSNKELNRKINQSYFDQILLIDTSDFPIGQHNLDVKITYKIQDKIKTCFNDNHRGTKHQPLPVYVGAEPLPKFETCVFGETHCHTNYTSDQLEFGASIDRTAKLASALGLHFFCATDHAYDLDDEENNYLKNDANLPKWYNFLKEVEDFNSANQHFKIIPGEEASLHNSQSKNVHCLIYNSKKFYPGKGDSGEKWLHPFSELTIEEVLEDVDNSTLVFAAHPVEPVPYLQQILIRRDNWHKEDCQNPRLNGLQFANGGPQKFFEEGKQLWISLLLQGHKLIGIAGNDAHGNFSRYRQVSFPFIKMKENYYHRFGVWRTGVYLNNNDFNSSNILKSIKSGNCFITNGPAIQFEIKTKDQIFSMGRTCEKVDSFVINAKSNQEFGRINRIQIFAGIKDNLSEKKIFEAGCNDYNYQNEYSLKSGEAFSQCYYRCEIFTDAGKLALSNPIWIK